MEDRLFEMPLKVKVNKNSKEFDLALLEEIKALSNIPTAKFDTIIRKIMKKKSSCKLWFTNTPSTEWDYDRKSYRECNYRCCPSSHKAGSYFCLILDRKESGITVLDGFLSSI